MRSRTSVILYSVIIVALALFAVLGCPAVSALESAHKSKITGRVTNIILIDKVFYLTVNVSSSEDIDSYDNWLQPDDVITGKALSFRYTRASVHEGTEITAVAAYEGEGTNGTWYFYDVHRADEEPEEIRLTPAFSLSQSLLAVVVVVLVAMPALFGVSGGRRED